MSGVASYRRDRGAVSLANRTTRGTRFFFLLVLCFGIVLPIRSAAGPLNLTGRYSFRRGNREAELEVLDLKNGRIKIAFDAYWIGNAKTGNVNLGSLCEEIELKDNVAIFQNGACKITIKFSRNRAIITQEGSDADCGFGHNVYVGGTYIRRSGRKPKFEICDR